MLTFAYAFRPWDFTLHVTRKFLIPELDRGMDYASFELKKKQTLARIRKPKVPGFWWFSSPVRTFRAIFSMTLKNCFNLLLRALFYISTRTKISFARFPAKNIFNIEPYLLYWPIRMLKSGWRQWEWMPSTNPVFLWLFLAMRCVFDQKSCASLDQYITHLMFVFYIFIFSELTFNITESHQSVFSIDKYHSISYKKNYKIKLYVSSISLKYSFCYVITVILTILFIFTAKMV